MKVLMHVCCGPCASFPLPDLLKEGHEVYTLFYNPNIHPYTEHERRRQGYLALVDHYRVSSIELAGFDPEPYLQAIAFRENQRCRICYQLRLEKAAEVARKGKFDAFTSSLLISPHQKHEMIREIGENCAEKYKVPFLYRDWRPNYRDSVQESHRLELYRQSWCGCLYSEWERYRPREGKG